MRAWQQRTSRQDRGATLLLFALLLTTMMVVAALVIDLSMVRQNRQTDKSAADFAVAAGIRALDNPSKIPQPWKGICAARDFLLSNHDDLVGMTGTFQDQASPPTAYVTDPCASPGTAPYTSLCADSSPGTWGRFTGLADGGRIRVTIEAGYQMPDPEFPQDAAAHSGDDGDGPCDNLAVIIDEGEPAYFGGVVGADRYETRIRSVARLVQGNNGDITAALVLLERNDCLSLHIGGASGATVEVGGWGNAPGVIHSDSLGNGADCNPGNAQDGNILQVDSNPSTPLIIARRAASGGLPGQISLVALSDAPGAVPATASSPTPVEVCVQVDAADCGPTTPVTGGALTGRATVGRGRVDARYRIPITQLRDKAATRFLWEEVADLPTDADGNPLWVAVGCADPVIPSAPRIWVDCDGGPFSGNGKTFGPAVEEVVINGSVVVDGNGNQLRFADVDDLYVKGSLTGNAIELKGGDGNKILVNDGTAIDSDGDGFVCDDRPTTSSTRTRLVVGNGPVVAEGNAVKVLRMCNTTLFLMDDSGTGAFGSTSGPCPVPTGDGLAPYDNGCRGVLRVAGQGSLDWSAPNINTTSAPTAAQLANFEDLAFWTETQSNPSHHSAPHHSVEGQGGVRLAGIFFTPNADPFRIGGQGAYDILDAQFITRRLEVAGQGVLMMMPQPQNSIGIPVLGGFTLVR